MHRPCHGARVGLCHCSCPGERWSCSLQPCCSCWDWDPWLCHPTRTPQGKGLAAARCPVLPPATPPARCPSGEPGSHSHPPVPSTARTAQEERENTVSLFPKGSGKKCCVTRGKAKSNRPWQPDTAPGQGAQTAPAGCGMRTSRQGRGSRSRPCAGHSQPTPAPGEGQLGGPLQRVLVTGMEERGAGIRPLGPAAPQQGAGRAMPESPG